MGRQAYITRLALGRSPYEAPVLSESGEFILGPYAHEFDNTDGYTQQYNERGHPENRASRAAARELRRAKNDVLSTVGVVYKKAKPTRSEKNDSQLVGMTKSENEAGFLLASVDGLFMFCSLWWLFSLRMRLQAFESHSVPLIQIIKSEIRVFGMAGFLFAGLPACIVSAMLSSWRKYWMVERVKQRIAEFGFPRVFDFAFFLLYSTIDAFGTLQSLHLIPAGQIMGVGFLVPSNRQSPFQLSRTLFGALTPPFLLLWAYTSSYNQLQAILWYVIRSVTTKPDKPDRISFLALEGTEDAEAKIPGFRELPWTLSDEVVFQSSKAGKWFKTLLRPLFSRRQAGDNESRNLSARLTDTLLLRPEEADGDRASTATPDPMDLFNMEDILEQHPSPSPAEPDHHPLSRANTLFTPLNQSPATTPPASPRVRASLIHRDSETVTLQLEILESLQGIDNEQQNQSLEALVEEEEEEQQQQQQHQLQQQHQEEAQQEQTINSEEVADHTSVEAEAEADVETMVSELAHAIRQKDGDGSGSDHGRERQRRQHRVTALSNFSSDAFASHAACLITTAALLPLETLFVRSLAAASFNLAESPARRGGVRTLFSWQGWRYSGALLLILGLQALVSSTLWALGTGVALGLGRGKYGWGKL